jgi:hypothetical protein
MDRWESLIDQKIREGIEQGEFDSLHGQGEPVDLSENPFEDPDLRTAHRLLHNAGFAPAWIEERKDIDARCEAARADLERAWCLFGKRSEASQATGAANWQRAVNEFREIAEELNQRIRRYNLKVPAAGFQRKLIDTSEEIARIRDR